MTSEKVASHLWASEIRALEVEPEERQNVCLLGVVVHVNAPADLEDSRKPISYQVDDGTGVIRVSHFLQKRLVEQGETNLVDRMEHSRALSRRLMEAEPHMEESLKSVAKEVSEMVESSRSEFPIGTCVEVKGRVQKFNEQNEVLAFTVRKVEDANIELDRILTMEKIRGQKEASDSQ